MPLRGSHSHDTRPCYPCSNQRLGTHIPIPGTMGQDQEGQQLPVIGPLDLNVVKRQYDGWLKQQHPAVDVVLTGLASGCQGAVMVRGRPCGN